MLQNKQGMPPTKYDCKAFQANQGLSSRVMFDPSGATSDYGGKETFMVAGEKSILSYKAAKLNLTELEQAVVDELDTVQ